MNDTSKPELQGPSFIQKHWKFFASGLMAILATLLVGSGGLIWKAAVFKGEVANRLNSLGRDVERIESQLREVETPISINNTSNHVMNEDNIQFVLQACSHYEEFITCEFTATNYGPAESINVYFAKDNGRVAWIEIFSGEEIPAASASGGEGVITSPIGYLNFLLEHEQTREFSIRFTAGDRTVSRINMLRFKAHQSSLNADGSVSDEINWDGGADEWTRFRNIPVTP